MSAPRLILASTSHYRRELLARLGLAFDTARPEVDETPLPGESAPALATRLAQAKAQAVADDHPRALIIGSDQVAELEGRTLGKPGTPSAAQHQLAACSGRRVRFHTAVCLTDTGTSPARVQHALDTTEVAFRSLDAATIVRYVAAEDVLACAGSFKAEGLGISLFERIRSDDPTALIGLPLIALARLLRAAGIALP